ncbi:MAG TPA: CheR family methyltransferase [Gemmatimonadales bacterium]|nr:CheR family methyltransferase [Gemmatimonadales bacterium]
MRRNLETPDDEVSPSPESAGSEVLNTEALPPESDPGWPGLLAYLLDERGFDFHGYKPASLARRIRKRMDAVQLQSFQAYQDYLQAHPNEFATLFNTILINVTGFFRDPAAWDAVRTKALPEILGLKSRDDSVRAWSAGCASGEEAYTIAMILAEELGADEFQRRVKIYATDVDDDALNTARHASYTERQVEGVPAELLAKYFDQTDGIYAFRKDLRRQVIFGRHDLINDAPISRVDLLACRNTLMYLNSEAQARVLSRLHFALNEGGFLLLGRAETLMAHGHTFVPVDLKRRLSRKGTRHSVRDKSLPAIERSPRQEGSEAERISIAALEASPVAQIVVDAGGELVLVNERARELFGLFRDDVGRPLRDLQLSYRPVELRSLVDRVESERRPVLVKEIEWRGRQGELRWLELHLAPLLDRAGVVLGTILTFHDATAHRQLQRELEQSHQELETAYEELQSTNEELETTNEELQSTVEELETTNEELQSTNEELETMNEELQSTNEELQALNDELRQRGQELDTSNAFLQSVLSSLEGGVAVVDNEFRILAWNRQAAELWGLREEEVDGKHLLNLDIGLPLEQIRPMLRSCLSGENGGRIATLDAVNRRGKTIRCQVTCTPLSDGGDGVRGAILLMEDSTDGKS